MPARRTVSRIAFAIGLAAVGLGVTARTALAQQPQITLQQRQEAKKLFNQAWLAYNQHEYEEAILKWEKSYEISHEPLIFEAISNAYKQLGDFGRAREYLGKYREKAPKSEWDALDARLADLVDLERDARAKRAQAERDEAAKREADAAAARARRRAEAEESVHDAGAPQRIAGWSLFGLGAASAIVGASLDGAARARRPDTSAVCREGAPRLCLASARDAIVSSNALALAGDVMWPLGAATAVAGLALALTAPPAPVEGEEPSVGLVLSPRGVVLGGTF